MALLITKKQKNLILHSETIKQKEFIELYKHLRSHSILTKRDIKTFSNLKGVDAYIGDVLRESQSEWKHDQLGRYIDLGAKYKEKNIRCELCEKHPIRYKYRLRNTINSNILIIGSECIKEFGADFYPKDLKRANIKTRVASLTARIERKIPGITNYIEHGWKYPQQRKVIIPKDLHSEWMTLYNYMKVDFHNFTSGKMNSMKKIVDGWELVQQIQSKIDNYEVITIEKQKQVTSLFDVTQEMAQWINRQRDGLLYQMIQNDNGVVSMKTIHLIYEENYMKKVLLKLRDLLKKFGVTLSQANIEKGIVQIRITGSNKRDVTGIITYKKLVELTKGLLVKEANQFDMYTLLNDIHISKESRNKIMNEYISSNKSYRLITKKSIVKLLDENELILTDGMWYYLVDISKFAHLSVNSYLKGILISDINIIKTIQEKMNARKFDLFQDLRRESN